ncbi:MAG: carbon-nitrogen hydrolase family protein [Dehalococcoidia bacterium]|nr:carbon-nitrogen hydrolase family protein [Dehalococcoidia bacterium]MDZ4245546.1 carbon-nitrogen hydrolase family protein [Dehalococcoidia bacterium]
MSFQFDRKVKVAAVQHGPVLKDAPDWFDLDATMDKAVRLIEEAGREGASLVVFPECWMPCFPYWSMDFSDQLTFMNIWAKYFCSSIEVPGRETEELCAAAKRAGTYVALGINERDRRFPGRMYNSILYLSPRGEVLGTHRKICNTVQERFFHSPGDGGDNLRTVFNTEIGNIGGSICGEHLQLPMVYYWLLQGIQIHCSLWPGMAGLESTTDNRTRSVCGATRAFGVLAATYMSEKNIPKNFYKNALFNTPRGLRGGSGIINPQGDYIAGPVYDEETIVYGEINLLDTIKARSVTYIAGIYSRWDLFSLNVRQEPYEPFVPMEAPPGSALPVLPGESTKDLEERIKLLERQLAAFSRGAKPGPDTA